MKFLSGQRHDTIVFKPQSENIAVIFQCSQEEYAWIDPLPVALREFLSED